MLYKFPYTFTPLFSFLSARLLSCPQLFSLFTIQASILLGVWTQIFCLELILLSLKLRPQTTICPQLCVQTLPIFAVLYHTVNQLQDDVDQIQNFLALSLHYGRVVDIEGLKLLQGVNDGPQLFESLLLVLHFQQVVQSVAHLGQQLRHHDPVPPGMSKCIQFKCVPLYLAGLISQGNCLEYVPFPLLLHPSYNNTKVNQNNIFQYQTRAMQKPPTAALDQKLDQQFVQFLARIEAKYDIFSRHLQIRIEKWVEKLLHYDQNTAWRRSRNNYIYLLHEMVARDKIEGIFAKMPPEKDIPNFSDAELKRALGEMKAVSAPENKGAQFSLKKIEEARGDFASGIASPYCQTDRIRETKLSLKTDHWQQKQKECVDYLPADSRVSRSVSPSKIVNLLLRNQAALKSDPEYHQILQILGRPLRDVQKIEQIEQEPSSELKVQQGIGINKANLFQFGSPRGMTQMQYFKAALQL